MPLSITLTAAADSTSGPFPPNYPAGAFGFMAAASTEDGSSAGAINKNTYFGATILAIANDTDSSETATQFTICLEGSYDQTFLGDITYTDGSTVYDSASANFIVTQLNGVTISQWIWGIQSSGVLESGTITFGDTGDTFVQLAGQSQSSSEIELTWTNTLASPAPTGYDLYRAVTSSTPSLYQEFSAGVNSFTDTDLTASTQYTYYVVATYSDGTNATSAELQLWTPASGISATFNCDCLTQALPGARTLGDLTTSMMRRLGYAAMAANPPPGMTALLQEFLQDAQRQLYRQHDELHTERMYAWQMELNQRYYGLQADESDCRSLDPYNVTWVGFEDLNQAWYQLINGINPLLYTRAQISTGWPTHYEIRSCIEIFPAPKAPYTLWIKGRFGLDPFSAPTDVTTLDSEAVFLLALGLAKSHYGQADAQSVLTQADNFTKYLVAKAHHTARYVPRTRIEAPMTPPRFLPLGNGSP